MAASPSPIDSAIANRRSRRSRWREAASAKVSPRPERISISVSISSPFTEAARSSSARQASNSSSKRCSRSRVAGSRIANSSSIPIVKSVEDSKTVANRLEVEPGVLWLGVGHGSDTSGLAA